MDQEKNIDPMQPTEKERHFEEEVQRLDQEIRDEKTEPGETGSGRPSGTLIGNNAPDRLR